METLLQRQDWLDSLRKEMWLSEEQGIEPLSDFKSICHGEPWVLLLTKQICKLINSLSN